VTKAGFGEDATGTATMWCRGATAAGVQVAVDRFHASQTRLRIDLTPLVAALPYKETLSPGHMRLATREGRAVPCPTSPTTRCSGTTLTSSTRQGWTGPPRSTVSTGSSTRHAASGNNSMSLLGIGTDMQQMIKSLVLLAAVGFAIYNKKKVGS
jgi:hypothetical protein